MDVIVECVLHIDWKNKYAVDIIKGEQMSVPYKVMENKCPEEQTSSSTFGRSSVHIQWTGFEDAQSEIERFEVCIGSTKRECNVVRRFNALLHSNIIRSNLSLPVNTELFASVWAFNKVGLNVSESSNGFYIDESPPVTNTRPTFNIDETSLRGYTTQWDRSLLKLNWEFVDKESPIVHHKISLMTHHDGHLPIENIVIGSENQYTITLEDGNWLNNGDKYVAKVTACNAAGLCTTEGTNDLLVDATPPHMGGLQSHQLNTWNNFVNSQNASLSNITLGWYGFYDQESTVDKYFLTVSRSYFSHELSDGIVVANHNPTSETQCATISLVESLKNGDTIIVSVWAINGAGLNSSVSKTTLMVIQNTKTDQQGSLRIQKHECDIHSCNNECTCSVVGQPCVMNNTAANSCTENVLNITVTKTNLQVFNSLYKNSVPVSASSSCLAGHWSETEPKPLKDSFQRFEWSLGVHNHPIGDGIFDLKAERPWNDIGIRNHFVYCLPTNKSLVHNEHYVVYVRAWHDSSSFTVFTSLPITIDHTPPTVRRGRYIIEGSAACDKDLDFIYWNDSISACWNGVFSEQQSKIVHYTVGIGTSPNGKYITYFPCC